MKLFEPLNHNFRTLWRWNAAVGKRNEAAVVGAWHGYKARWLASLEQASLLPWSAHWVIGAIALGLYHLLTAGVALPDNGMLAMLACVFWSFGAALASRIVMIAIPQPYEWLDNWLY